MRIPGNGQLKELQECFRRLWQELDALTTRNIDLHGKRIINAGPAEDDLDYVTKRDLDEVKNAIWEKINSL